MVGDRETAVLRAVETGEEKPALVEPAVYDDWHFDFSFEENLDEDPHTERRRIVGEVLGVLGVTAQREFSEYDQDTVSHLFTHGFREAKMQRFQKYLGYTLSTKEFGTHVSGRPRRRKDLDMDAVVDEVLAEQATMNHPIYQLIKALKHKYGDKICRTDTYDVAADVLILTREPRFRSAIEAGIERWRGTEAFMPLRQVEEKKYTGRHLKVIKSDKSEEPKDKTKKQRTDEALPNHSKPRRAASGKVKKTIGKKVQDSTNSVRSLVLAPKPDTGHNRRFRQNPKRRPGHGKSEY